MKKIITILFVMFGLLAMVPAHNAAADYNPLGQVCSGNGSSSGVCQQASSQGHKNPILSAINKTVKIIGIVIGVAAIFNIVIGGLNFVTSAGNPEKIASARKRIIYSLVGIVIAALAWAIVGFATNHIL